MQLFRDAGIPLTLGFAMSYHWRAFIMFQGINLTRDPAQNAKARALYERIINVASERGWGIYETLNDALDPNGSLLRRERHTA